MANINEELVREFFEQNGFSVKLQRKYILTGSERIPLDHIDLLTFNASEVSHELIERFILTSDDIQKIDRAAVGVRGWHTETFSPSVLQGSPELFYFAQVDPEEVSKAFFRAKPFVNILVLPMLPVNPHVRKRSIDILRSKKVNYVIEFRTILRDLIEHVEINRNYSESSVLQLLRILKKNDLLKEYQLDLFEK